MNWGIWVNGSLEFVEVHIWSVFEVSFKSMVFTDDWIKHISKVLVRIFISCINSTMLVWELNCTCNCLGQCKSRCLGFFGSQSIPLFFGNMLGNKTVFWLDVWEWLKLSNSVLFLEYEVLLIQSIDTVNHSLHQFNLSISKAMFVRDIIGASSLATRFSAGATGLDTQLFTPLLKLVNSLGSPSRKVNVDWGSHTGSQVGWARVEVSEFVTYLEVFSWFCLNGILDSFDSICQACEDSSYITTFLHGNDTELIFLIDPGQERFFSVVEDSTTFGPITLHTSSDQVFVTRDEQEVIINKLLACFFVHSQKWVVVSSQITL